MKDWQKALRARNWMKRNESFLYTWHAYVGNELNLFKKFQSPVTVQEVAEANQIGEDLLQCWVEVGVSIKHLRKRTGGRYRTSKKHCGEFLTEDGQQVAAVLKEMMELHIPTLLAYPKFMQTGERAFFNHEKFGSVVAETSSLLEHFAIRRIRKLIREREINRIIDIGCGYGGYLRKLAETFPDIEMVGVDMNEKVIEYAQKASIGYDNITFVVGNATNWHPNEQKADLILLHNIFHYVEPSTRGALLGNISNWLEEEGLISVITPLHGLEQGQAFSSVFNSFFTAHSNLYALPNQPDITSIANAADLTISDLNPIVKEGGWYSLWLTPNEGRRIG
ncbi:class I SAM-dependent methyltransferase [Pontibacillus salicampi]|uniref:Class I SAM-dependent methyltransferase n=1 Tax=Pontibacillus salicampi TaxID=1449801 RepID=A0ABV6LIB9_9BACI